MLHVILVAAILLSADAQMVPISGSCSMSTQCMTAAICVSQICTCPPMLMPMGGGCMPGFGAYGGGISSSFYGQLSGFGGGFAGGFGGGMIYPGSPCSAGMMCGGGSYCYSGTCSCPAGYIISTQTCVQQTMSIGMGSMGGCPMGYMLIASSCVSQSYMTSLGSGYGCSSGLPCSGGSFCSSGMCTCQQGFYFSAGACMPMMVYAQPGSACGFNRICTGGAVCMTGTCGCQQGYMMMGSVCIYQQQQIMQQIVPVGNPCMYTSQCGTGAFCGISMCRCMSSYFQFGSSCYARARSPTKDHKQEKSTVEQSSSNLTQ